MYLFWFRHSFFLEGILYRCKVATFGERRCREGGQLSLSISCPSAICILYPPTNITCIFFLNVKTGNIIPWGYLCREIKALFCFLLSIDLHVFQKPEKCTFRGSCIDSEIIKLSVLW